jgi:HD-GYP domain-containing protein (c-di-GMP phosphodiesterase class II)
MPGTTHHRRRGFRELRDALRGGSAEALCRYTAMLGEHDASLVGHVVNVSVYSRELSRRAGLSPRHIEFIRLAGLLHDVGKLFVPAAILEKDGALTRDQWRILQRHAEDGWKVVKGLEWSRPMAGAVRSHHERWDGAGYPDKLSGEQIPIEARILAVADTLDAMTTDRPYRKALSFSAARDEIAGLSNRQFDPAVVGAMLSISEEDWEGLRLAISIQSLRDAVGTKGPLRILPARPERLRVWAVAS